MKAGPAFFNSAAGAGFTGPLDSWTTGLWAAFSTNRLLASYTAHCLTARDSTTTTTQDIGFASGGYFDSGALATFLGAHNGTCRDWANQEGTISRSLTQATSGNQSGIATAGTFLGKLVFDGTNDVMTGGAGSGVTSAFTVFFRGLLRSTSGTQIILEHSANYNSNEGAIAYYDAGLMSVGVHDTVPGGYSRSDFTGDYPNNNVQCWKYDRSQVTSAAMTKLYINGTVETRNANGDSGTLPAGGFVSNTWNIGARSGGTVPAALDAHTLLIYESALSDGDIASISTIVAALT